MRIALICTAVGILAAAVAAPAGEAAGEAPKVRAERPRVFLREKAWEGPSVEKLREWMKTDEYKLRARKLPRTTMGKAVLYLSGDEAAGKAAVEEFKKFAISGDTPSYQGIEAQKCAAMYDWLRNHPDFDEASRKAKIEHMEKWSDGFMKSLAGGGPSTPFYSRVPGAISALTVMGLALHGDSPKADEYVHFSARYLREKIGTVRQMEDGATGGGSYGLHHEFTDLANLVACWRSATDWDAARWIKENQGNWLERQMLYQAWTTYPNGLLVKHGDLWDGSMDDKEQYRMHIDAIAGMYRNGFGRSWADDMARRWPKSKWDDIPWDYHTQFAWEFFVFNDPEIKPRALEELGRAEVFSPKLHGIVCWRDSWKPDATIVHFVCGETVDHHATYDQGKFMIFKHQPLAIKAGAYTGGYMGKQHRYFKSTWSSNVVMFTGPDQLGEQPKIDFDGTPSWAEWKAARDKNVKRPPTGVLVATEANDRFARALGDLAGSVPAGCDWKREMVFLGYKYALVLDRVRATPELKHRWTLHSVNEPKTEGALAVVDNEPGRLFCRTLLPEKAKLTKVGGPGHECDYNGDNRVPKGKTAPEMTIGAWRLDVEPEAPAAEGLYLHVLFAADTKTEKMPEASVEKKGDDLVVKVADLEYTFKPAPAAGK
ncbi:MAG TPA: hypothetical protein PK280_13365 [Planctomycetota bacterium]|nr:hypothetical protein [Planctomycetota bacterium]